MSYVIAKSISVRKDKTTMVSRSSNVWPADYYSSTFPTNPTAPPSEVALLSSGIANSIVRNDFTFRIQTQEYVFFFTKLFNCFPH